VTCLIASEIIARQRLLLPDSADVPYCTMTMHASVTSSIIPTTQYLKVAISGAIE